MSQSVVPITLNERWMSPAFFAVRFAPIPARITVIQVPMFCPRMIGTAEPKVISPVAESACRIPIEAEEL